MSSINPLRVLAYSLGITLFCYGAYSMVFKNDDKTGYSAINLSFVFVVATKLSEGFSK